MTRETWNEPPTAGDHLSAPLTEITRREIAAYAGASGDTNRVHVDEPFALESGHPSVIAHGMLTMGLAGSLLTSVVRHTRVRSFGGRFRAPVVVGDTVRGTLRAVAVRQEAHGVDVDVAIDTTTDDGTVVFTGTALVTYAAVTLQ